MRLYDVFAAAVLAAAALMVTTTALAVQRVEGEEDINSNLRFLAERQVVTNVFATNQAKVDKTMLELIYTTPTLSTLAAALVAAGLDDQLGGTGPYTVMAPWNRAFDDVPAELLNKLLVEPEWMLHLQSLVNYHIHDGLVALSSMSTTTTGGSDRSIRMRNGDDVFMARSTSTSERLTFNDGVRNLGYYAPTNGVAYLLDQVLLPTFVSQSLVDVVTTSSPDTSTLASLIVVAAGLEDALRDPEAGLTVLAPTNAAFEALDPDLLAFLQSPQGLDTLKQVLLYHVLPGVHASTNTMAPGNIATLEGQTVQVAATRTDTGGADDGTAAVSVNGIMSSRTNVLANSKCSVT
jgi:uncharacterized surface protein with fasciclin (FAS1) repeats